MELTEEEFFNKFLLAYEQKEFSFITMNWRILPSHIRLEIMLRAFRDGEKDFISKSHFELHENDLKIIQEAKQSYIEKFNLSPEEVGELYWWYNTSMYINNKYDSIIRNLAITAKLREYDELTRKYSCLTPELIKSNPNILKCDSRRTESRIKFLLEQNNGEIPKHLMSDLTASSRLFTFRYQREIEEKKASIDSESPMYSILMELDDKTSDYTYDKYLELCLRAMYGEENILDSVNKKRDAIDRASALANNSGVSNTNANINVEKNVFSTERERPEELLDEALPVDEGYRYRKTGHNSSLAETKPNNREPLDEGRIEEELQKLRLLGIECEGYISSNSGTPAIGEEKVRYYILRKGERRIAEPLGQVGNRTLIFREGETLEDLRKMLMTNTQTDLVRDGLAARINHERTKDDQSYVFSLNRLQNIFTLAEEFSQEKSANLSISALKNSITKMISQGELPEVSRYIWELGKHTALRIANFVKPKVQKENEQLEVSSENTSVDTVEEPKTNNSEEVEI